MDIERGDCAKSTEGPITRVASDYDDYLEGYADLNC